MHLRRTCVPLAALAVFGLASAQATAITPAHTTDDHRVSAVQTATTSGSTITAEGRPFSDTSSWNTPIPDGAQYTPLPWPESNGYNYGANWEQYAPEVHYSTESDPVVQVQLPDDSWGYPSGTYDVRVPRDVTGASGTDGELVVVDGTTVWNFWQFERTSDTTATVVALGKTDIVTGSGWGTKEPFLSAGVTASGASELAGLLTQRDMDNPEIDHAINIIVDAPFNIPGPVGEAINGDGAGTEGQSGVALHEGQRLGIPCDTPMPEGLSPLGQKVFRALQVYGGYDIDSTHGMSGVRMQYNAFDDQTVGALRADLNKIMPLVQKVD